MKKYRVAFLVLSLCITCCPVLALDTGSVRLEQRSSQQQEAPVFVASEIPEHVKNVMLRYSWRQGCPLPLEELRYLSVAYWGYDERAHQGELIVHRRLAEEVLAIFRELFDARFPIEKMRPIDAYEGSDDRSMADNNSSGFNCRTKASNSRQFSKHSYGIAIDLNPLVNPYVRKGRVLPPEGRNYLDRQRAVKGMIRQGDECYMAFVKRGWRWGGAWKSMKDYQHFEKELQTLHD